MHRSVIGAVALALVVAVSQGASASVIFDSPSFSPTDFTSLGTANISGVATANTDSLTLAGFSGVLDKGFAIFDFSNFTVATGADLVATGSHPLVILSRTDINIFGEVDASAISELDLIAASQFSMFGNALVQFNDAGSLGISAGDTVYVAIGARIVALPEPASGLLLGSTLLGWQLLRKKGSKPQKSPIS